MQNNPKICSLCSHPAEYQFSHAVLGKYYINYYKCSHCDLMQTETPYWLEEAYQSPIASIDTGIMTRNHLYQKITAILAYYLTPATGKYLDYGGGYGIFTRLMRDIGFDYYWRDPYSPNLIAKGFEDDPAGQYDMITAFEVAEHIERPLDLFQTIYQRLKPKGCLLFSTNLYPPNVTQDWFYFVFSTGQHVSFYSQKTLAYIAEQLHLNLYTDEASIHLLSARPFSQWRFQMMLRWHSSLYRYVIHKKKCDSKTWNDFLMLSSKEPRVETIAPKEQSREKSQ
ncbi:MAG: class I SAM-dependent methyltransferase [Candidatus Sumerlaeota bacterium]|nr:class I SAM-dependent methyltransferase [Candidatus Sumerlaeota bacterium]